MGGACHMLLNLAEKELTTCFATISISGITVFRISTLYIGTHSPLFNCMSGRNQLKSLFLLARKHLGILTYSLKQFSCAQFLNPTFWMCLCGSDAHWCCKDAH